MRDRLLLSAGRAARLAARFCRDDSGANAVEFGLVAIPFFTILLAIIEAAMAFFASQIMETALRDAARLIRTGQATSASYDQAAFKTQVCNRVAALLNCTGKLYVDVRSYSAFASADFSVPTQSGNFNPNGTQYQMGNAGSIVVARAFYAWPSITNLLGRTFTAQSDGSILLVATTAFRNEPWPTN